MNTITLADHSLSLSRVVLRMLSVSISGVKAILHRSARSAAPSSGPMSRGSSGNPIKRAPDFSTRGTSTNRTAISMTHRNAWKCTWRVMCGEMSTARTGGRLCATTVRTKSWLRYLVICSCVSIVINEMRLWIMKYACASEHSP